VPGRRYSLVFHAYDVGQDALPEASRGRPCTLESTVGGWTVARTLVVRPGRWRRWPGADFARSYRASRPLFVLDSLRLDVCRLSLKVWWHADLFSLAVCMGLLFWCRARFFKFRRPPTRIYFDPELCRHFAQRWSSSSSICDCFSPRWIQL